MKKKFKFTVVSWTKEMCLESVGVAKIKAPNITACIIQANMNES